jgi:hypothetical protein
MRLRIKTLLLVFLFTCIGCASVTFLPTDESVKYPPTDSVKIYWKEPTEPYKIIGRVSAESGDYGEGTLFKMLKKKAMAAGAHAIIVRGTSQEGSSVGYPVYGGGTYIAPVIHTRIEGIAIRFIEEE